MKIAKFITENCITEPGTFIFFSLFYKHYAAWCHYEKLRPETPDQVSKYLGEHFQPSTLGKGHGYKGLKII